jgi:hypothetical protein
MIGRLTFVLVLPFLGTGPALGQTASAEQPALPAVQLIIPAPDLSDPLPRADVLPSLPGDLATTQVPVSPAQLSADTAARDARIAALRARFEDLQQRDARLQALTMPAAPQTLAQVNQLEEEIAIVEAGLPLLTWKAENLAALAQALSERPEGALPASVVPGITPEIALAVIRAQTTLYAEPRTEAETVIRTLDTVTTMLRVAEVGPFTLVWSPQDRFAFVLSQFREVY